VTLAPTQSAVEGSFSVLLAEDDDRSRDVFARRLQRRGHEVVAVADGRDALTALAQRDFDVVLLDWMMPELSGLETLTAIKMRIARRQRAQNRQLFSAKRRSHGTTQLVRLEIL
jgi:CheY-like chemotaxis protein